MQHALDLARPYAPLILALVVWPIVGAALSWWLWWDTPEHWEAYAKAHPGRALAIRALRTVSPHLRKLVVAWRDYAAARSSLPPLGIALPAEKTGALVVSETRGFTSARSAYELDHPHPPHPTPADGVAHDAQRVALGAVTVDPGKSDAPSFDPHARQTVVPPARDDGQRGSVDVRGLLAVVVALSVVLPLGVALYGCPASRQLTRPALGQVDGCEPRSTRCSPTGRPQVCSGSRRWTDADAVCALGVNVSAVCCLTRSPVTGAELHACVLAERCLPVDAGSR